MTPNSDPLTRKGYESATYGNTAYTKPDMVLQQLEALLGHTTMSNVMTTYTREMAFKHPTHLDFKRVAERISGRNLDTFGRIMSRGREPWIIRLSGLVS